MSARRRQVEILGQQRRLAVAALMACAWLIGVELLGFVDALAYLAPTLAVVLLLVLGRYPGERAIRRRVARPSVRQRRRMPAIAPSQHPRPVLPRGSALLGAALAGRAPPAAVA